MNLTPTPTPLRYQFQIPTQVPPLPRRDLAGPPHINKSGHSYEKIRGEASRNISREYVAEVSLGRIPSLKGI